MEDKSNCSVICTLFKIALLGKWDEVENVHSSGPFRCHQFPRSPHIILCILSNTVSPPALNCSVGTSLGPVALRMARATSERSGGGKCNCSQFLSLPHFPFSSQYKSYPPVCDLCSCSQIFASCWLDALQTWVKLSIGFLDLSSCWYFIQTRRQWPLRDLW